MAIHFATFFHKFWEGPLASQAARALVIDIKK